MKNKIVILAILVGALIVGGGGGLFLLSQQKKPTAQVTDLQPTPTPVVELTTWIDQSEYSFQYPKDLTVNGHEEDQENYSHVELTSSSHPGNIILWTKDTTAKDIATWAKQQKVEGASIETILGGELAKKLLIGQAGNPSIVTIHDGYLYQIDYNPIDQNESKYWNPIFDTIVSSYTFTGNLPAAGGQSAQSAPSADTGSSDVEYEGEEVIE